MLSIAHVSYLVWYRGIAQNMRETNHTIWLYVIIFILLIVSYDQSSNKTSDLDPETEEEIYFYHPQCNCYR